MKKPDEAKAIVVYVEKEFPTVSDSYIVAFIYYALLYDVHNALKELDNAVKIDPKDEKALDHRASYKDEIADEKGAIADFNKLIDLNPTEAKYFYGRSSANFDRCF